MCELRLANKSPGVAVVAIQYVSHRAPGSPLPPTRLRRCRFACKACGQATITRYKRIVWMLTCTPTAALLVLTIVLPWLASPGGRHTASLLESTMRCAACTCRPVRTRSRCFRPAVFYVGLPQPADDLVSFAMIGVHVLTNELESREPWRIRCSLHDEML